MAAVFNGPFHTMPLDNTFDHGRISHREGHNLYGFWETEATNQAFVRYKPGERPFILTLDMYSGSQRWAAPWTGDNVSNWEHLRMSLPMNMNIGISGIPMVGNDVGGFALRPSAELMKRWLEVGALLPFARDRYDSDAKAPVKMGQEPFAEVFSDPQVESVARRYIRAPDRDRDAAAVRPGQLDHPDARDAALHGREGAAPILISRHTSTRPGRRVPASTRTMGTRRPTSEQGAYNQTTCTVRRTGDGGYTLTVTPERTGFESDITSQTVRIHNVTDAPAPVAAATPAKEVRVRYRDKQDVLVVRVPKGVKRVHVRLRR